MNLNHVLTRPKGHLASMEAKIMDMFLKEELDHLATLIDFTLIESPADDGFQPWQNVCVDDDLPGRCFGATVDLPDRISHVFIWNEKIWAIVHESLIPDNRLPQKNGRWISTHRIWQDNNPLPDGHSDELLNGVIECYLFAFYQKNPQFTIQSTADEVSYLPGQAI